MLAALAVRKRKRIRRWRSLVCYDPFRKRIFKLRLKKSPNNIFANDSHIKQKSLIARISNASTHMKDLSFSHGATQVWRPPPSPLFGNLRGSHKVLKVTTGNGARGTNPNATNLTKKSESGRERDHLRCCFGSPHERTMAKTH